jgi:hypothetical protein
MCSQFRLMSWVWKADMKSCCARVGMSAPAAKAFSLPVSTMQPMPSSASKACSAAPSSSISGSDSALSAFGRFRRIRPVLRAASPWVSTRMFS